MTQVCAHIWHLAAIHVFDFEMKCKNAQISNMLDSQRHIMVVISNTACSLVAPTIADSLL